MRRSEDLSSYPRPAFSYETYEKEDESGVDHIADKDVLLEIIRSVNRRKKERRRVRKKDTYTSMISNSDAESCDVVHRSPSRGDGGSESSSKHGGEHVQKVHKELSDIYQKLRDENARLHAWDLELIKKQSHLAGVENQLSEYARCMKIAIEHEAEKRCGDIQKVCEMKMQHLEEENRRSRSSFKVIKKANELLKEKVVQYESKLKSNEQKQCSMQSRISNLQRKIELLTQQINEQGAKFNSIMKEKVKTVNKNPKDYDMKQSYEPFYETFAILLQWISETHLKQNVCSTLKAGMQIQSDDINVELTNSRAMKIIIYLPNVLHKVALMNGKIQLAFIQFIYWSMLHLQVTQSQLRLSHSATYRRIGEDLFQPCKLSKESNVEAFFRSADYRIRLISSLIIVHTITQADILVQVFQSVTYELKHELTKELFLEYRGAEVFLPFFKLTSKVSLCYVVDILMLLAVESPYQQQFINQLGSLEWIQAILVIMKACYNDTTLVEKLSLLMQRVSKLKNVKPVFDALQVKSSIMELSQLPGCDGEYLQLNLRSILFNIESMRTHK